MNSWECCDWIFEMGRVLSKMIMATIILPFLPVLLLIIWIEKKTSKNKPAIVQVEPVRSARTVPRKTKKRRKKRWRA